MLRSLTLCLLVVPLAAQRTWIVDQSGGTGTDFREIQSAVDAARAGDVILVRRGTYGRATVGKGVRMIGESGVTIRVAALTPPFHLSAVPRGELFSMRGFRLVAGGSAVLTAAGCRGVVHFEDLDVQSGVGGYPIEIRSCDAISMHRCELGGGVKLTDVASGTISDSTVRRRIARIALQESAALQLQDVRMTLSGLTVEGPNGSLPFFESDVAVRARRGTLRILRGAASSYTAGLFQQLRVPAIWADVQSSITIDPAVRLVPRNGADAIAGGVRVARRAMASLAARGGLLGKTTTATVFDAAGAAYGLFASLPARPVSTPFGTLWLDVRFLTLATAGTIDSSGRASFTFPHASDRAFLGLPLTWQALSGRTRFELTNSATVSIRP